MEQLFLTIIMNTKLNTLDQVFQFFWKFALGKKNPCAHLIYQWL